MYTYKTRGVCSTEILFDIKNDIIRNLRYCLLSKEIVVIIIQAEFEILPYTPQKSYFVGTPCTLRFAVVKFPLFCIIADNIVSLSLISIMFNFMFPFIILLRQVTSIVLDSYFESNKNIANDYMLWDLSIDSVTGKTYRVGSEITTASLVNNAIIGNIAPKTKASEFKTELAAQLCYNIPKD